MSLDKATILVTGAAGGIGRGIAEVVPCFGGRVIGLDRVEAPGIRAMDVIDRAAIETVLDTIFAEYTEGLIGLVNAAGIGGQIPFLEIEERDWRRMIDINLTGTFNVTQLWARRMVARGAQGAVVSIASLVTRFPTANNAHYTASKGGVDALTRAMATALAPHGIRVNAVAPGPIPTELNRSRWDTDAGRAVLMKRVTLGRLGTPADVAYAVAFLLSPMSAWTTGETLYVDGGVSAVR